ncbi:hypothetical protein HK100_000228 [Physocladia obscura]|uniref:Uncharacterized protein n=1 Tax=Physocladia obscura TaxID=109957 RepID=A0AAD5T7Z1_9FUNG|nr:hypothetical protein HK100_000228 [Physocladia obscura]
MDELADRDLRGPPDKRLLGFDEHSRSALADFSCTASSIVVVSKGKIVFAKGFGADGTAGATADALGPDTPVQLGASAASIIAGIALAASSAEFDFNARVPFNISTASAVLTYSDLLSARAALPANFLAVLASEIAPISSLPAVTSGLAKFDSNKQGNKDIANIIFRGEYSQSPLTAPLVCLLACKATEKNFEYLVHNMVFAKFGASKASGFWATGRDDSFLGVTSSARDMGRLIAALLGGWGPLSPPLLKKLWNPCGIFQDESCPDALYPEAVGGFRVTNGGWMDCIFRGKKRIGFSSYSQCSSMEVSVFPQEDFGVVVMCNKPCYYAKAVANVAADFMLQIPYPGPWVPRLENATFPFNFSRNRTPYDNDSVIAKKLVIIPSPVPRSIHYYVGVYKSESIPQLVFKVIQSNGCLYLRFLSGQSEALEPNGQLQHFENGIFYCDTQSFLPGHMKPTAGIYQKFFGITFENGQDGSIEHLTFFDTFAEAYAATTNGKINQNNGLKFSKVILPANESVARLSSVAVKGLKTQQNSQVSNESTSANNTYKTLSGMQQQQPPNVPPRRATPANTVPSSRQSSAAPVAVTSTTVPKLFEESTEKNNELNLPLQAPLPLQYTQIATTNADINEAEDIVATKESLRNSRGDRPPQYSVSSVLDKLLVRKDRDVDSEGPKNGEVLQCEDLGDSLEEIGRNMDAVDDLFKEMGLDEERSEEG